jgi:uncharacterized protein
MSSAQTLIQKLQLLPHPEGGHYRELFRSSEKIGFKERKRAALTTIYFLLEENECSRWHWVDADEVWHFYEGSTLQLFLMPPDFSAIKIIELGEVSENRNPVFTIPAGWWQAARSIGDYTLCGCTVAPAFEFEGFRFLTEAEKEKVKDKFSLFPELL